MAREERLPLPSATASTMVISLTPEYQRERAHAMPVGPAPTMRTRVLDGKDIVWCEVGDSEHLGGAGGLSTWAWRKDCALEWLGNLA